MEEGEEDQVDEGGRGQCLNKQAARAGGGAQRHGVWGAAHVAAHGGNGAGTEEAWHLATY